MTQAARVLVLSAGEAPPPEPTSELDTLLSDLRAVLSRPSPDAWQSVGGRLGHLYRRAESAVTAVSWAIGDWILAGQALYMEEVYDEAEAATGLRRKTLYNLASAARRFPPDRRAFDVPHSHYTRVLGMDEERQDDLLGWAAQQSATREELEVEIARQGLGSGKGSGGEVPAGGKDERAALALALCREIISAAATWLVGCGADVDEVGDWAAGFSRRVNDIEGGQ